MSTPETKATFSPQQPRVGDLPGNTSWFMGFHLSWLASSLSVPLQEPGHKVPGACVHPSVWPWVSHFTPSHALLGIAEVEEVEWLSVGGLSSDWLCVWGSQWSLSPRVASIAHLWDILQEQNQQLQQFRPQEARANSWSAFNDPKPRYWLRRQLNLSQG